MRAAEKKMCLGHGEKEHARRNGEHRAIPLRCVADIEQPSPGNFSAHTNLQ